MDSGWEKSQLYVINELKRQAKQQDEILDKLNRLIVNQAVEKTKLHYMVSGIAVFITAVTNFVFILFRKGG